MTSTTDQNLEAELRGTIDELDCVAGTIHRVEDGVLELVAYERMPDEVLERVQTIPFGKGMAGIAAERSEPVQICNLQTDDSGVAESGAKETGLEGTIAVPMFDADDELAGVLGVGKEGEYEFSDEEAERLVAIGRRIAAEW